MQTDSKKMFMNPATGLLAEQYVNQRYAHISQDVERMREWIYEALWSFAEEMEEDRLEEEIRDWDE